MPSQSQKWFFRSSELAHGDWDVHIDAANPPAEGWKYTGLRIGTLNKPLSLPADANERIIFLLEGTGAVVEYVVAGGAPASQVVGGVALALRLSPAGGEGWRLFRSCLRCGPSGEAGPNNQHEVEGVRVGKQSRHRLVGGGAI